MRRGPEGSEISILKSARWRVGNRKFLSNPIFLGTERVLGKKVTDLFCLPRDVPGNGAGEIGVVGRGAKKSAFKKKCEVEILTFF